MTTATSASASANVSPDTVSPDTVSPSGQLRQKAHDIKDTIVDMAGIAKGMATDTLTDLKEGASARYRTGVDKAGKARDGVVGYVKDNPGKSLLACLCLGALAGFLVSRRR